jgi:hypothetical protein
MRELQKNDFAIWIPETLIDMPSKGEKMWILQ